MYPSILRDEWLRRSPHGERGLKFEVLREYDSRGLVALLMESVD